MNEPDKMFCPICGNFTFKRMAKYDPTVEMIQYGNMIETEIIEKISSNEFSGWIDTNVWCLKCEKFIPIEDLVPGMEKKHRNIAVKKTNI